MAIAPVRAFGGAEEVACRIRLAQFPRPVGVRRPRKRPQRVVGVACGARRTIFDFSQLVPALPLVAPAALLPAARAQALAGGPARRVVLPVQAQTTAELAVQFQALGIASRQALPTAGLRAVYLPQHVALQCHSGAE